MARKLQALGDKARIVPAKFVKPYIKSNKTDLIDAEAIAEAVTRPTMRFVQVKTTEQVDTQALHRIREQLVSRRTKMVCQMRAFCLEYGVVPRLGIGCFKLDLPTAIANNDNDLTPTMRRLPRGLTDDMLLLEQRIDVVTKEIEALAAKDDTACRLMTIPGSGPLGATAIIAAVGDGRQFRKARDLSSWLGISKRGNPYVRKLVIHDARSCLINSNRERDHLGAWLNTLEARMHRNKVAVALANKLTRVVWVILTKPGATYLRTDPRFA